MCFLSFIISFFLSFIKIYKEGAKLVMYGSYMYPQKK